MKTYVLFFLCCLITFGLNAQGLETGGTYNLQDLMGGGTSHISTNEVNNMLNPANGTTGSQLFLGKWLKGSVTTNTGSVIGNDSLSFVYNKISHNLFYKVGNMPDIRQCDPDVLSSFELYNGDKHFSFVRVPEIDPAAFFQALVTDSAQYSLYKLITTTYIAANFQNNGYYTSGSKYDQYKDQITYYIVYPDQKTYKEIDLRKHSFKEVFGKSNLRLKSYFNKATGDVDEGYLISLVKYLDNKNG